MVVGLSTGLRFFTVGNGDFFNSFFSTIFMRLENGEWGSRFPVIMNNLYQGLVHERDLETLYSELKTVQEELKSFSPNDVIWDFEDLSLTPPWGNDISPDIHNLSHYFITSNGENLFDVLYLAVERSRAAKVTLEVKSL